MTVSMAADRAYSPAFGDSNPQENKSSSGFTPLPPIRRTSTFDLLSRKKLGADDDDRAPSPVGSSDNDVPPVPPLKQDMNYQNGNGHIPNQGQGGQATVQASQPQNFIPQSPQQHPAFSNGPAQNINGYATGRGAPQPNGFQQQMFMGRGGPVVPPNQFGQLPGQPGVITMSNQGQPFISQMGGNPIQKIPPGPWKLEESHLSEPLIQHKRPGTNSPLQQQPGYYAYDKETEDATPPVKGQGVSRPRPRNNSNNIPPVSAERFRNHNIFVPHGHEPSEGVPQQQAGHPLLRGQPNNFPSQGERGFREAGPSKEMDVRVDQVSLSSVTSEDQPKDPGRRGSGFFGLGTRRNTGAEQGPDQNAPAKEKGSFFGGGGNHNKFQPKQKSNLGLPGTSSFDHDDTPPPVSMKKRLSELTGMIKGVGNAKEGAKDDQPAKPGTGYAPRPSMQGPMRTQTGQGAVGQPSPLGGPPMGMTRSNTGGPRPGETQQPQGEDEKKHGFLGGFFNKQGSKAPESKQPSQQLQHPAQRPPPQFPIQASQQFRPGQMPPPGQQFGPQQTYGGQPPIQEGLPGQPGVRRFIPPGQLHPPDNVTSPSSPQFLGMAQAVMMRRPSEITVSSQNQQPGGTQLSPGQRSQFSPQQSPPVNPRPSTSQDAENRNLNSQPGRDDFSAPGGLPKDSPHSRPTSPERVDSASSIAARTTPNRKPVGSGFARQDGASTSSAPASQSTASPTKPSDPSSQPSSAGDEKRLSSHLPSGQQSPTLGKLGHVRQTSLPSPGRPPMLSQPGQVTFAPAPGGSPPSSGGPLSPQDRQPPRQPHETSQGHPGMSQPGQGPSGYLSSCGNSPQHNPRQNPQAWGPNYSFANQQRPGLPQQNAQGVPRFIGNPAIPPDQQKTIAKFFGVDSKGKNIPLAQPPKESKEKEKSAASKLLGAFKRGSKQSDPNQSHQPQRPPPGHQTAPHVARPQQGGPSQQAPATRPQISGPLPAGPLGPMSSLPSQGPIPPGQGRGVPPPQGQPGYGPMGPPMMTGAGRGEVPPQMQAGRGQNPQNPQAGGLKAQAPGQQRRRSAQNLEPQYAQVPIPRGYEAVHGYGNAGMIAPSPYNVGRPSPPPLQQQQFQSFVPQGAPQQQFDPRTISPPGQPLAQLQQGQQGQQAQSIQRSTDSESSSTPTPSEQGTFLDMAPTPPPRPSQDEYRFDRQAPPPVPPQFLRNQPSQPQVRMQANPPAPKSLDTQTPSSSNWGSAPDSAQSPHSQRRPDAPILGATLNSKPSDPNVSPPSDNDEVQRPQHQHQHQHIATAMSNDTAHPPILQPGSPQNGTMPPRAFSPTASPPSRQLPGVPNPGPQLQPTPEPEIQVGPGPGPAANRLVSKMSTSNMNAANAVEPPKNTSLSPDIIANRAASVSPEPPGPRSVPFHQVSNTSLNINVERANDVQKGGEDDIYDATPRVNRVLAEGQGQGQGLGPVHGHGHGQGQGQDGAHENTKYAGSSPHVNGAVVAGTAAGAGAGAVVSVIAEEASVQEPGPGGPGSDDSSQSEKIAVPRDHEEKILVEQPVELAAVNDDDDGIPVMSATSYPGQEWNPYGAGEFGDWD